MHAILVCSQIPIGKNAFGIETVSWFAMHSWPVPIWLEFSLKGIS